MTEAVHVCSNRRRALIRSWETLPATGAIEIERVGDENITINHGCSGGDCGGGGNSGGDDGGNGSDGGGIESDSGIGCGRSSSLSMTAATGAAKTKKTMKTITAVAEATAGASTAMRMKHDKRTRGGRNETTRGLCDGRQCNNQPAPVVYQNTVITCRHGVLR